ncbi:MAG: 2'-5' RNA ligase [Candidatus Tokpelaia hoelldobleri]|uniref:RNA 2',3'-cyclic phosphodiesterase n=1 Tax=Candidatus Tokpelaia hoelldobleri TaxID=1902579 RepID=A0A1U9JSI0_9HYPH|nr:MAG: 2'-5' RNA ligase [Candidatus Tokpelaia hoelldoblerii]
MPRLFAALQIPHDAALSLSLLRSGLPAARWVEVEDYHITLRFFGDVDNRVADAIVEALDSVTGAPFSLQLKGVDVFTPKKPRALYAGVAGSLALIGLQERIERASRKAGVKAETRKFIPHVTLARLNTQVLLDDLIKYLTTRGNFESKVFNVARFVLMSSKDSVGGGPYKIEEVWPLNEKRL